MKDKYTKHLCRIASLGKIRHLMINLPSFAGLVRVCDGLDGAGNPWDVNKVHTNTQYLSRELGRRRLILDSKSEGCTKGHRGI